MDTTYSTPKARKKHVCEVCSGVIKPGETYCRAVTFDSGDVLAWKSHQWPCQDAVSLARDAGYGDIDGLIAGEDIAEWGADDAVNCFTHPADVERISGNIYTSPRLRSGLFQYPGGERESNHCDRERRWQR